jgi:plasmid stabilization system protein ParE
MGFDPARTRVVRILHGARDLQAQFGQDIGQDS